MTRSEFNVWVKRHQALFPKLTDWLGDQEQPGVILDAWASAMATCVAAHAADATERMLRGVAPLVEFNDWASLPAVVIAHCRPLGSGRQERTGDGNFVSGADRDGTGRAAKPRDVRGGAPRGVRGRGVQRRAPRVGRHDGGGF